MSPPIHKDWWLAAALTGAALPTALAQTTDANRPQTGVVTSVTQQGQTSSAASAPIYIDGTRARRLVTRPNQTMHVLFSDQSAITVGPNSELTIAEYKYDAQTRDGNLLIDMTKGVFRVVGGFLSKKRETTVRTVTSTIGIRGGITIVEADTNQSSATFLFGQQMRMTSQDGQQSQTITRPGFGVSSTGTGLSDPRRVTPNDLSNMLSRLESRGPTPSGGAPTGRLAGTDLDVRNIAPDRVGTPPAGTGLGPGRSGTGAPTLADILGTQAPGNQS
jgi:hypothetical protein